ncbi:MAG TPA: nitronate monooxygenase [Arachnia sp.]|nr:nitronate monooxygenase [Arachnia sp.]HMT86828.1 nitronate monooxygenase [Arachnia sp.]
MTGRLLASPLPIVAAPMAGGATTVGLAAAVATAGGFPFLAGGYKTPEALASEIAQLRCLTGEFGVNLFVPSTDEVDEASFAAYAAEIAPEASVYGLSMDATPRTHDDWWEEKLALLRERPVPVVSFTFGLPEPAHVAAFRRAGTRVLATVTSAEEARRAAEIRVDGLVVQGPDAGGHSAVFDARRTPGPGDTAELVRQVRHEAGLPVIAAGGIDGPAAVRRLAAAGAEAMVVGTLLLRTDEAGTSPSYRDALADPRFTRTVITRAFTGRPARALCNGFVERHRHAELIAYPAVHHLTLALRRAASAAGDADRMHLWAGTGYRSARTGPASQVVHRLAEALA